VKASSSPFLKRSGTIAVELVRLWAPDNLRRAALVALCAAIAAIAFVADTRDLLKFGAVWVPPLILTLVIRMALQPLSARPAFKPGLEFAGRTLLRVAFLLPAIAGIAWWVAKGGEARPTPPVFLFGFLVLAALNSLGFVPPDVKAVVGQVSAFLIITAPRRSSSACWWSA
jgi:uncharacterized membrane protein YadS